MKQIEPRTLKGFRDYGPAEQLVRQNLFASIQSVFERFGFLPLSTPVLEYKEILTGKYGEDEKLIYQFTDNGDREVAMRYDLTVPLARYVAQNQGQLTLPFKRYQIAPVWRADNPQKGRLREFYQCDIDVVGTDSPIADAEVIACIHQALTAIGLTGLQIRFNNRMLYNVLLSGDESEKTAITRAMDKLDKIGKEEVLKILKEQGLTSSSIEEAEKIIELGKGSDAFANILKLFPEQSSIVTAPRAFQEMLISLGVPETDIIFDPAIVRGLDYYTNMVFEITISGKEQYGSIAGGGRYDGLLGNFSDTSLSAVGGSIGIDRLLGALYELNLVQATAPIQAIVFNFSDKLSKKYAEICNELRGAGINTELYYEAVKIEKQFKYAESKNIPFAILLGEEEMAEETVLVKNLETRQQEKMPLTELVSYFQNQ